MIPSKYFVIKIDPKIVNECAMFAARAYINFAPERPNFALYEYDREVVGNSPIEAAEKVMEFVGAWCRVKTKIQETAYPDLFLAYPIEGEGGAV